MPEASKITILYVDDEENNQLIFKLSFRKKYSVLTASSGDEGLRKLEEHKDEILVVISDMRMPKMSGVEFVSKARELSQNVAYFILTGFEFNDEIDKALKNNMIERYFTKPFDISEIESAIELARKQIKK